MKEIDYLKKLDRQAAAATPPAIDVSQRVAETLRNPMRLRIAARLSAPPVLWVATGLSWAAAAACLVLATQSLMSLQDPFGELLNPLRMVMQ